ncbi:MAG: hypothetical protein N2645_23920 [Clostridia bacterium]|nr:hypothetical protein [Clostridia bacterium]
MNLLRSWNLKQLDRVELAACKPSADLSTHWLNPLCLKCGNPTP